MRILDYIKNNSKSNSKNNSKPVIGLVNCALRNRSLFTHWMFHEDYPFAYVLGDINNDDKIY